MGKHKHRRRHNDQMISQQMPAPMPGLGGLGDMLGGGMGGGMNGLAGILSSLGGIGGSGGAGGGMSSILSGLMGGGGGQQGGDPLSALGGIGGIMNALQGFTGAGAQTQPPKQPQPQASSLKDMLSNISESDMDALRDVFNGLLKNDNSKAQPKSEPVVEQVRKQEQSIEQILSSLDFNSILSSINNMDLSNFDFDNIDFNNIDLDNITFQNQGIEDEDGNITTVEENDIIEENIFRKNTNLTEKELYELVGVLIKLIEPSKLKALEKLLSN